MGSEIVGAERARTGLDIGERIGGKHFLLFLVLPYQLCKTLNLFSVLVVVVRSSMIMPFPLSVPLIFKNILLKSPELPGRHSSSTSLTHFLLKALLKLLLFPPSFAVFQIPRIRLILSLELRFCPLNHPG